MPTYYKLTSQVSAVRLVYADRTQEQRALEACEIVIRWRYLVLRPAPRVGVSVLVTLLFGPLSSTAHELETTTGRAT